MRAGLALMVVWATAAVAVAVPAWGPARPALAAEGSWRFLGPRPLQQETSCLEEPCQAPKQTRPVSGRVTSLAVDPRDARTVFAGSAGGGVWKSVDAGRHWRPVTTQAASLAIGALAIDPSGRTVYAGTGEINGSDSQYGQGILKSTDGGATWTLLGQQSFAGGYIGGLSVDSTNPNHVLAATNMGLFESPDAGRTWTRNAELASLMTALGQGSPSNQVYEVHEDPSQPSHFVASFGDGCTTEAGGIATSEDDGEDWEVTYTNAQAGRIGVGMGPGGVGYGAVSICRTGGIALLKSVTDGSSWSPISPTTPGFFNIFSGDAESEDPQAQGTYDNAVAVDPTNPNNAVFGGVRVMTTTTGGNSFTDAGHVYAGGFTHADFHAFAFTGASSFYVGNDGGVWSTTDMGGSGTSSDYADLNATLETLQFNAGTALDLRRLVGGTQDNGSPGSFPDTGLAPPAMTDYSSGDGGNTAIDPTPGSRTFFAEQQNGRILRVNSLNGDAAVVPPCGQPSDPACQEAKAFYAPYVMDPANPARLLAGAQRIYQTSNGGGASGGAASWQPITPNLTNSPLGTASGTDYLASIAIGPRGVSPMFTASNDGRISRSVDGATWANVSGNLPELTPAVKTFSGDYVKSVAFDPGDPAEAWVGISASNVGRVWHTVDAGAAGGTRWTDLSGSGPGALPAAPVRGIAEDQARPGTIYAGSLYGAWVCSSCGGASARPDWHRVGVGLPNVEVDDLTFTADHSTLLAWTHGWGVWALPLGQPAPPSPSPGVPGVPGWPNTGHVPSAPPEDVHLLVVGVLSTLGRAARRC